MIFIVDCVSELQRFLLIALLVLGVLLALLVVYFLPELYTEQKPPELPDEYFGPGKKLTDPKTFPADNPGVKKFEIEVPDSVLQDLHSRLTNTRFSQPLENVEFQYGFHASYLKEVVDYWKDKFDWRKQEKELNQFNHYTTQIEGLNIHFINQKPDFKGKKIKVYPLLISHGWPGSIAEFTKFIPLLTAPRADRDYVFEVICPSIPGYGFSEAPHQTGFNYASTARIFTKLMKRLGFTQYYVHGGDLGSPIVSTMATVYPNNVLGVHLTHMMHKFDRVAMLKYLIGRCFPSLFMNKEEAAKLYPMSKYISFLIEESGYFHIQATKPDTVGSGLSDSPAGLAAYILEKFSTGTDKSFRHLKDGGLTKKMSLDELLTNVMIYWSTNTITSAVRFYKENIAKKANALNLKMVPIKVPVAIAAFPKEVLLIPQGLVKHVLPNTVRYTNMLRGGHFASMEEPALLADDIWDFVKDVQKTPPAK